MIIQVGSHYVLMEGWTYIGVLFGNHTTKIAAYLKIDAPDCFQNCADIGDIVVYHPEVKALGKSSDPVRALNVQVQLMHALPSPEKLEIISTVEEV